MQINGPTSRIGIALTLLIGLASMGYGAYSYTTQSAALDSTVEVTATVTDTSVERNSGRRSVSYVPQVTFQYRYEGEQYASSNVYPGTLGKDFDTEAAARDVLEPYEPGETTTAYVPTDDPGDAFLEHERSNKPFLLIGVGVLFVLSAAYSAIRN
ncbi:DUF3592 domain-containing protein [Haloplanus halophilus]|uniref:DUF3592 domain-containing protein n=1 Tax=Haloplanus halophilus TaxID=2949993 RepID=UPI00203C374C|nr:DUF3592 domain-containing protein [Haloplanus sp. GDY1]